MGIKNLKIFSKATLAENAVSLGQAIANETDRGAVILLSTAVEDVLTLRLKSEMVTLNSDETKSIFGTESILGSFSAKIKMAYALGFIDREITRVCDLVREMRNACAHCGRAISFADKELGDVLCIAINYVSEDKLESEEYTGMPIIGKLHFTWLIGYLMIVIKTGSKDRADEEINQLIADATLGVDNVAAKQSAKRTRKRRASRGQSSRKRLTRRIG